MRVRRSFARALVTGSVVASIAGFAVPAQAVLADKGIWDGGAVFAYCGSGTNSRTCTYDFYAAGCTEAAVAGLSRVPCEFEFRATVAIAPILDAAGRIVGCTSVPLDTRSSGRATYDSTIDVFDNPDISDVFTIEVRDVFADGRPGVGHFSALDDSAQGPAQLWFANGAFVGVCAPGADQGSSGGAGSITVVV
jgi:hypothetical protein